MLTRRSLLPKTGLVLFAFTLACSSAPKSKTAENDAGNGGDASSSGGQDNSGGKSSTNGGKSSTNGGKSSTNGGKASTSGGKSSTNGGAATNGGTSQGVNDAITLTEVSAKIVSRLGADLQIDVTATGDPMTVGSVQVTLEDADSKPLVFFDSNFDNEGDSATGRLIPDSIPTTRPIKLTVVVRGAGKLEKLGRVSVALVDKTDAVTESKSAIVTPLPRKNQDEACDPAGVKNRCLEGLTCSSTSKTCVAGTTPTITKAAYTRDPVGPILRVQGTDPEEDVVLMRLEFLSAQGLPLSIDMDGDDIVDVDNFETSNGLSAIAGGFIFFNQSGLAFDETVPKFLLYAIDSKGNKSPKFSVAISDPTLRGKGQSCELSGFDSCAAGTVCVPRTATQGLCTELVAARTTRCSAAQKLKLVDGYAKVSGTISGADLWQAPAGCILGQTEASPETVFTLHVENEISELTISTAQPETTVNTVLYLLPNCTAPSDATLTCNDDTVGFASELKAKKLPAGDYVIVVEARPASGGSFGLTLSAK